MGRLLLLIFMMTALALPLASCGKKGSPQPPADVPNTFPRTYPHD
jgi:predicted small lipoprotein YifL